MTGIGEKTLISFITINFNGLKDTDELIASLKKHVHSVSYEIIVVDNASKVDEASLIKEKYPDVHTIRSEKNTGFSGGNNLGIRESRGKYIFLINNDTYVTDDHFQELIDRLESSPQIGAVSPKIRFAFPPQNIQFAGYTLLTPITLRNQLIGFGERDGEKYNTAAPTPYLHGAAMILKKEVIDKVGMMPEIFFLYYEELDWCTHIRKMEYELWYEPKCTVFHKESQSTGQESKLRTYYLTRNRLLYAWRNASGMDRILSVMYQMMIAAPKNCLKYILKRRVDLLTATIQGIFAFITLPNKLT